MYERRQGFSRHEEPASGRRVEARVKWFNSTKGFGFVTPSDGSQDAFLPIATLRRAGFDELSEGASLLVEIGEGGKGPLVVAVLNVDESTAAPAAPRRSEGGYGGGAGGGMGGRADRAPSSGGGYGGGGDSAPRIPHSSVEGAVKWFEPTKGYGFISPDQGGKDIFVHVTALRRSGLESLEPGARVRVDVVDGRKGLEADRISVL